jgi:hypothetical protein
MDTPSAFNVMPLSDNLPHEGYRVYLASEQVYFMLVGDLGGLIASGFSGEYQAGVGWGQWLFACVFGWIFLLLPWGRASEASGKEILREMELKPLDERLASNPANFVAKYSDFTEGVIEPLPSLFRKTYGQWRFQLPGTGQVALAFANRADLLPALKYLPERFGNSLIVQGREELLR